MRIVPMSLRPSSSAGVAGQGGDVEPRLDRVDDRHDLAGGVPQQQPGARAQRLGGQPADGRRQFAHGRRPRLAIGGDQVAAGDVDVVGEPQGHRAAGRRRSSSSPSGVSMPAIVVVRPTGSTTTLSPTAQRAALDPAGVAAVVGVLGRPRPDHDLHREAAGHVGRPRAASTPLEVLEQDGPVYQSMRVERSTTLSPTSAATGIGTKPGQRQAVGGGGEVGDDRGRTRPRRSRRGPSC